LNNLTVEKFPQGTFVFVVEDWYRNGAAGWFEPNRVINKGLCGEVARVTKGGLVVIDLFVGRQTMLPPGNIRTATLEETTLKDTK